MKCRHRKFRIKHKTEPKFYLEITEQTAVDIVRSLDWRFSLKYYTRILNSGVSSPVMKLEPHLTVEDLINQELQNSCPGNYTVGKVYDTENCKWNLELRFKNPEDETVWMLKHG
jgi:hypothetical protein